MALLFEKSCREEGLKVKIIPLPRSISASCGLACSFPCDAEAEVRIIVKDKDIEVASYHKLTQS